MKISKTNSNNCGISTYAIVPILKKIDTIPIQKSDSDTNGKSRTKNFGNKKGDKS